MAERAGDQPQLDVSKLLDPKKFDIDLKSPEKPEALQSRLKREEAEADHKLRMQEAEDAHRRRISLIVHIFVMTFVGVAFLVSAYLAMTGDPKSGVTEKAMNIITAIVAAGVGFITGKGSK